MRDEIYFVRELLNWGRKNKRRFSWRNKNISAYKTLVAEIMLQKTNAEKVELPFKQFVKKYPTAKDLNKGKVSEIKKIISVLGLQKNKSHRLKLIAEEITSKCKGRIPVKREELMKLKGIGDYSANALICFGFNRPAPLVDTNTARIISRFFGYKIKERARTDKKLWRFIEKITPTKGCRDFNYALLDFAHAVCKVKPLCSECIINNRCRYFSKIKGQLL